MDTVSHTASIIHLCEILTRTFAKVRRVYGAVQEDPTPFYNVIFDVEIQLARLQLCQQEIDQRPLPASLLDITALLQEDIKKNVEKIRDTFSRLDLDFGLNRPGTSTSGLSDAVHPGDLGNSKPNVSAFDRIQYVLRDKESIQTYATNLEKRVSQLRELVSPHTKEILDLRLQAQLLQNKNNEELRRLARSAEDYHYWVIQSSAELKVRLKESGQETSSDYEVIACDPRLFQEKTRWEGRTIGQYQDQEVMVEWKPCSHELSYEELKLRVSRVADLLHKTNKNKPKDLIILDCMGAITLDDRQTIGLVYRLPPQLPSQAPGTLYTILPDRRSGSGPAMERRRNLACVLARAIFQLHVVGWVHKGVRPHNIAFFGNPEGLESPYLIGFDYARKADLNEKSERADPAFDLYRHPKAQGDARWRFQHAFDLFALGLILLEIGLWQRLKGHLSEYEKRFPTPAKARRALHERLIAGEDVVTDLPFYMGSSYCDAVKILLSIKQEELRWDMYPDIIHKLEARE